MKKLIVYIFIVCIVCLLGCQPTPEIDFVKQKDSYVMLEKAKEDENGTSVSELSVPTENYRYEAIDPSGTIHLKVDAEIVLPSVQYLPVARVFPRSFTEQDVKNLYAALLSETIIIDGNGQLFKGYWQPMLDSLLKQQETGDIDMKYASADELDAAIQEVLENMSMAPDKPIAISPNFSFEKRDKKRVASLCGARDDRYVSSLELYNSINSDDLRGSFATYERDITDTRFSGIKGSYSSKIHWTVEQNHIPIIKPTISQEDAKVVAEQVVSVIGTSDYRCAGERLIPIFQTTEEAKNGCQSAYEFLFTRCINDVVETYTNQGVAWGADIQDARKPWRYEKIRIFVDDNGIYAFLWDSPSTIEVLNQRATILPFDQIQAIFEKEFMLRYGNYGQEMIEGERVYLISKICFGLARICEKDHTTDALLVPVWDFFGTFTDESGNIQGLDGFDSWLTINAVDGTVIDRRLGY